VNLPCKLNLVVLRSPEPVFKERAHRLNTHKVLSEIIMEILADLVTLPPCCFKDLFFQPYFISYIIPYPDNALLILQFNEISGE